jgi:hypothetical protein
MWKLKNYYPNNFFESVRNSKNIFFDFIRFFKNFLSILMKFIGILLNYEIQSQRI